MSLSHQLPVPCSSPKTGPSSENAHREPAGGCALRTKGGPAQGAVKSQLQALGELWLWPEEEESATWSSLYPGPWA